jgi:folate-binding protein YgfZ
MSVAPHLEPAQLREGAIVYLDDHRARIRVSGDDRVKWLNGILSNDLLALDKDLEKAGRGPRAQYACALDAKGKILGDAIVVLGVEKDAAAVFVPAASSGALLEAWDRYIVMEDVEIARDDERRLIAVHGVRASEILVGTGLDARAAQLDELGVPGWVLDVGRAEAEEIARRIVAAGAVSIDSSELSRLRVEAARATFGVDVDEKNYVQEGGLDARAVSFSKGCYLGQEVVCMLAMRGHPTKRLVQIAVEAGAPIAAGAEVSAGGSVVGKITSLALRDDGSAVALAMIKWAHAKEGEALEIAGRGAVVRALAG